MGKRRKKPKKRLDSNHRRRGDTEEPGKQTTETQRHREIHELGPRSNAIILKALLLQKDNKHRFRLLSGSVVHFLVCLILRDLRASVAKFLIAPFFPHLRVHRVSISIFPRALV